MPSPEAIKTAHERLIRTYEKRPGAAASTGSTQVNLSSGMRCEITQSPWSAVSDQPVNMGGENLGPDPGFYGRAALGACLAQGYAGWFARRGLSFKSMSVEVEADSDGRGFLAMAPDVPPGYGGVRVRVRVESEESEADLREAMDQADRHSPWLYDFTTALEVQREAQIKTPD